MECKFGIKINKKILNLPHDVEPTYGRYRYIQLGTIIFSDSNEIDHAKKYFEQMKVKLPIAIYPSSYYTKNDSCYMRISVSKEALKMIQHKLFVLDAYVQINKAKMLVGYSFRKYNVHYQNEYLIMQTHNFEIYT